MIVQKIHDRHYVCVTELDLPAGHRRPTERYAEAIELPLSNDELSDPHAAGFENRETAV